MRQPASRALAALLAALCFGAAVAAGGFSGRLAVPETGLVVAADATTTRDPRGRPLYNVVGGSFVVEFSLTNDHDEPMVVVTHQTPLQGREEPLTANWLGAAADIFYGGVVAEDAGSFGHTALLAAGETLTRSVDLGPSLLVAATSGEAELVLEFPLRFQGTHDGAPQGELDMRSNSVTLSVTQAAGRVFGANPNPTGSPGGARSRARALSGSSAVALATSVHPGVPYWNYVCADDVNLHGWRYSDGTKVPCDALKDDNRCSSVAAACPVTCGLCAGVEATWTKPWAAKTYTTTSECTSDEVAKLNAAEALKDQYCANMLYCLEKKTADCDAAVLKWFGGTHASATQWETLRTGFAKLCSSTSYAYKCRPAGTNCKISFSYGGTTYSNADQLSIPSSVRDGFINQCQTSGCGYSATVAWVSSGQTSPREINLCSIGFWLQKDFQSGTGLGSKAATIVHELSHFTDLADTDDMTYSASTQIERAKTDPWFYLANAATWDNLSEDTVHGTHAWSSFSSGGDVNCAVSAWSSWGSCSQSCGGGTQSRTRTVTTQQSGNGAACPALSESQACNSQACDVNCAVSSWSSWGSCSQTCGGGTQSRTRAVTTQQSGNGAACPALSQSQACNSQACTGTPVDCAVSAWGGWSACSKTCGGGTQTRTRSITTQPQNGGTACPALSEARSCNTQTDCPVDCVVSSWSAWGSCSKTCGGGTQTRTRSISTQSQNGGAACPALSEARGCNTQGCAPAPAPAPTPSRCSVRFPKIDFAECCGTDAKKAIFLSDCDAAFAAEGVACTAVVEGSAIVTFSGGAGDVDKIKATPADGFNAIAKSGGGTYDMKGASVVEDQDGDDDDEWWQIGGLSSTAMIAVAAGAGFILVVSGLLVWRCAASRKGDPQKGEKDSYPRHSLTGAQLAGLNQV